MNTHDDRSASNGPEFTRARNTAPALTENQGRDLAAAVASVVGGLNPETVLQRLVISAQRLVQATRCTVSVVGEETPRIGALAEDGEAAAAEQVLQVPLRVGDVLYGTLTLAKPTGRAGFTRDEEQLLAILAAAAAAAIETAHRYEDARHRATWFKACAELIRDLLEPIGKNDGDALGAVAQRALEEAGAALVSIDLPTDELGRVFCAAAAGRGAHAIVGRSVVVSDAVRSRMRASHDPILLPTLLEAFAQGIPVDVERRSAFGWTLVVPMGSPTENMENMGALILSRMAGSETFSPADSEMIAVFGSYLALALERIGVNRTREERAVSGERERIARDLHDTVIQRIFAAGLSIQGLRHFTRDPVALERISEVTSELDDTIREVRDTIYSLRGVAESRISLRTRILAAIRAGTQSLTVAPSVQLTGPLDLGMGEYLGDNVIAVISEGLSNVVRHSGGSSVDISVRVARGQVRLVIADNGHGIPASVAGTGLKNLRERARLCGGHFSVTSSPDHGTKLVWSAPLSPPGAPPG